MELIDAQALARASTVEELAERADGLVRSMEDPTVLLAKPFGSLRECPDLLTCFGLLLGRLAPLPGMRVLDFGAGSCWTSHFLAQLGCQVVALDVSQAMLDLGRRRFEEHPPFGDVPPPEFVRFDGHRIELADDSVDRILCFDALHHVPNPAPVLAEMARVLRPGGLAGFSEPGPRHSVDPQSQHEMRRYGVPELDLVIEDVWRWAAAAGFAELSVGVFTPAPSWITLDDFHAFMRGSEPDGGPGLAGAGGSGSADLAGGSADLAGDSAGGGGPGLAGAGGSGSAAGAGGSAGGLPAAGGRTAAAGRRVSATALRMLRRLGHEPRLARLGTAADLAERFPGLPTVRACATQVDHLRNGLSNRRMFVLRQTGLEVPDSRQATGLAATLSVSDVTMERSSESVTVRGTCRVRNVGTNRWLPSSAGLGAVRLGLRLGAPGMPAADHGRAALAGGDAVEPGQEATVPFHTEVVVAGADQGPLRLEVDLVAEGIAWFSEVHGRPFEIFVDLV